MNPARDQDARSPRRRGRRVAWWMTIIVAVSVFFSAGPAVAEGTASAISTPPGHLTSQPLDARPSADARHLLVNAHNAGDTIGTAQQAVSAHAGMVEIDTSWDGSSLVAAHSLMPGMLRGDGAPDLSESWAASSKAPAVLLDLKTASRPGLAAVVRFVRGNPGQAVYLSTPDPAGLSTVHRGAPATVALLSLTKPAQVDRYLEGESPVRALNGLCVKDSLVTKSLVRTIRRRHLLVQVYGVNTMTRVNQLASWGATGVTTDSLTIMQSLAGSPSGLWAAA